MVAWAGLKEKVSKECDEDKKKVTNTGPKEVNCASASAAACQ